jgi:prepilin-type processing-associated H-X9-DG protein
MRDYYGVVGGGPLGGRKEPVTTNSRGDTFDNGFFVQNRWRKFRDVPDGSSNTFAVGESVHTSNWCTATTVAGGPCPGYGKPAIAGPDSWIGGDACDGPNCGPEGGNYSLGRTFRSTKYPINSVLDWTKFSGCAGYSYCPENDPPFTSFHSGGTHFVFIDGHVLFINETINFTVYQALGTIAGGETIPGNAY